MVLEARQERSGTSVLAADTAVTAQGAACFNEKTELKEHLNMVRAGMYSCTWSELIIWLSSWINKKILENC